MKYDFRSLFTCPPNSEEELFSSIERCISLFDPNWNLSLKPAPEEDIRELERIVMKKYGQELPLSYKLYLQKMGEEDGGLISCVIDDLEFWNYFKGYNMARGAIDDIEYRDRPYWYFYYTMHAGQGWGFSPKASLEQIIETGDDFYFSHDTFSKLLFYGAYNFIIDYVRDHGTTLGDSIDSLDSLPCEFEGIHSIRFCADCPKEWVVPGHTPLVNFVSEIESQCSLEECWFSGNKKFSLFDAEGNSTNRGYKFSRYVGVHATSNLIICINCNEFNAHTGCPYIWVSIISQDVLCTKQIVNAILQQVKLEEDTVSVRSIN